MAERAERDVLARPGRENRLLVITIVVSIATLGAQAHVGFRDGTAEMLFNTARNAVGGEGAISGVTSLLIRGTAQSAEKDGGPEMREVEIRILLPDGMLRIDTGPDFEKRSGVFGQHVKMAMGLRTRSSRPCRK